MIPQQVNEARCSNELLEHLEHLHETNDLFGNVAKSHSEGKWNVTAFEGGCQSNRSCDGIL
jgi:hypothetical protein